MFTNTHAHISTWVVALILFVAAILLFRQGLAKQMKIVHMTLRLFYILIIVTGAGLFYNFASIDHMTYGLKSLVGIGVIACTELILVRMKKGKSLTGVVVGLIVTFLITLYLGFSLPIGFDFLR
ncbi:YisL family protein [Salipaludibacillus sp. LMS25]|jgi:phage shock protein PspC (stress-responsive transcriptional regulator)|uniref:YisL family protein n=1 Tax=Salipaludibacillus sp. LMS25 TaxID=2924031 RepID=UPI0020D0F9CB|nr:YisL family protein [Salipaludibacillus sp. LMS25]UTR15309.1 YisL family protein [Salipaludibacillus sp. LMS25]